VKTVAANVVLPEQLQIIVVFLTRGNHGILKVRQQRRTMIVVDFNGGEYWHKGELTLDDIKQNKSPSVCLSRS
jgi:hypothetical protein